MSWQLRFEKIIANKAFEFFIIFIIMASALTVGAKTFNITPFWLSVLEVADIAITVIFVVEISAWVKLALFVSRWGPRLTWGASKVEGQIFNGVSLEFIEGLRDRCVWEVGLDELAALWAAVGSGFVCCLDAKDAKCKSWGFHPGEVGSKSKSGWHVGIGVRGWKVWRVVG